MNLHRDASNRLTASLDANRDSYRSFVAKVVRQFDLKSASKRIDGPDEVFEDFAQGDLIVALEWDSTMGCQVVAKSPAAEPLVEAIAAFVSA